MASDFPAEIEQFIGQHVESLAQLESLLALRREPGRSWSCAELARQLYVTTDVCAGIVGDLERRGFALRDAADVDRFGIVRQCRDGPAHRSARWFIPRAVRGRDHPHLFQAGEESPNIRRCVSLS